MKSIKKSLKSAKKLSLKLLFPQRCRFCDRVIEINETACKGCLETRNEITGEICMLCGFKKSDCVCKKHKSFYTAVASPYYYEGAAGVAVKKLKFGKATHIAESLSEDMAKCFFERFSGYSFDFAAYVPMTKKDEKKRGFNQAQLLAAGVSKRTGIPLKDALEKIFETSQQHTLKEYERSGNVLGVFAVKEEVLPFIKHARILLCDDVKTTGATLNECAKTLLIAGADEVFCLTATTVKKSFKKPER